MGEMVKRVALAIRTEGLASSSAVAMASDEALLAAARAAVAALREPTNQMIHAGALIETPHPITVWRAMIDAALRE